MHKKYHAIFLNIVKTFLCMLAKLKIARNIIEREASLERMFLNISLNTWRNSFEMLAFNYMLYIQEGFILLNFSENHKYMELYSKVVSFMEEVQWVIY